MTLINWFKHKYCIYVLNKALSDPLDDSGTIVESVLQLDYYDRKHSSQPIITNKSDLATFNNHQAQILIREYVKLFKRKYQIDQCGQTELNPVSYHNLADLDIDLLPISEEDKLRLTLLHNLI